MSTDSHILLMNFSSNCDVKLCLGYKRPYIYNALCHGPSNLKHLKTDIGTLIAQKEQCEKESTQHMYLVRNHQNQSEIPPCSKPGQGETDSDHISKSRNLWFLKTYNSIMFSI